MLKELCQKTNYKIINYHYFYFSLFLFRLLFKDKNNEINNWKYPESSIITKAIRTILNIDYSICKTKLFTGLSLLIVIEKQNQ